MKVGKVVGMEQLQQIAAKSSAKVKKPEPSTVEMKGANGESVEVKIGSGLEKTAMFNAIFK
jgi:hypothetical protein